MTRLTLNFLFLTFSFIALGQSLDDSFSQKKMKKDFEVFKDIRHQANSGLYKYREKAQIDSIYNWAEEEIEQSSTYRDFYNIIVQVTDFEGSLHNSTDFPEKFWEGLRQESSGYFPYPIKWIEDKWILNFADGKIPLGAEIIAINNIPMDEIIRNLYKYYSTDGDNITGKRIGLRTHFPMYYRGHYGSKDTFKVEFKQRDKNNKQSITLEGVGFLDYYKNFRNLYSKPIDQKYYMELEGSEKYDFHKIDSLTGVLTIHSFAMGNEHTEGHKNYVAFLDSIFTAIKNDQLKNLIVDIRQNGGGDDPNDLITYSYLTQRNFQENTEAWISFNEIPLLKYKNSKIPKFLRPFIVGKYNKQLQKEFPIEQDGRFYQDENSDDHQIRTPNSLAFTGNVYLLISPAVASAGSLFAAMLAGNKNTITIGEETMGGYYGHNGHTSLDYKLPKSKIITEFSIVNLEQDVPEKLNQHYNRGIIPDYPITQTFDDFLNNVDTQMNFTLKLVSDNLK